MHIVYTSERLSAQDYIDFLKRTDLGSQYPKERFAERIETLVARTSLSLTARDADADGLLVGVLFGLTDFAYWLFVSDLGIDRAYVHKGIGKQLMANALEAAGGEKNIIVYTCANDKAIPFYQKLGMRFSEDVLEYNHIEWTGFTVE